MKRHSVAVLLILLSCVSAFGKKKSSSIKPELLHANFVYVVIYPDDRESVRLNKVSFEDDRRALAEVEAAIKKWGRWTVLSSQDQADLVIEVRRGRKAGAGMSIPTRIPSPGVGATASVESGPAEDMIAI